MASAAAICSTLVSTVAQRMPLGLSMGSPMPPFTPRRLRRFYFLMIEYDLFGTVRLVHNRGRIGINGQELVDVFASGVPRPLTASI
jgi:hypothetical protein